MNRPRKVLITMSIILLICIGLLLVAMQTKIGRQIIDDLIYDNQNHYLPCEQLPTEAEVMAIIERHQDSIQAIKDVNLGYVGVDVDTTSCPGKADLVIWYGSHDDRLAIEAIIEDEAFFGIPYRLRNQ